MNPELLPQDKQCSTNTNLANLQIFKSLLELRWVIPFEVNPLLFQKSS